MLFCQILNNKLVSPQESTFQGLLFQWSHCKDFKKLEHLVWNTLLNDFHLNGEIVGFHSTDFKVRAACTTSQERTTQYFIYMVTL